MIPVEAFAPLAAVAVALITVLGSLLVRERRRNNNSGNPGNPGSAMRECPILGTGIQTVIAELQSTNAGIESLRGTQGKVLDKLDGIGKAVAIVKDRGERPL